MKKISSLFSKKNRWKSLGALVLILALGAGGFKFYEKRAKKAGDLEDVHAEVERGDLEVRFEEIGDIAALNQVDVASKVSGRVVKLHVQEGDTVEAGRELAVIQPGKTGAEKFLPSTLDAPIRGVLLRYAKNPEANNAAAKFVEVGDYVTGLFESANPTYLMTIADMSQVIVKLKINEMDILKLREKMPVEVKVDAIPDKTFPAVVHMIAPQAEKESRGGKVFRVEVLLQERDASLRTGMTARVSALLQKRENVLKMPLTALFEEKGEALVYLDRGSEKPKQVFVKAGLRTEIDVEIEEGLKEGDKVHIEKPVESEELTPEEFKARAKERKKDEGPASAKKSSRAGRRAMRAVRIR